MRLVIVRKSSDGCGEGRGGKKREERKIALYYLENLMGFSSFSSFSFLSFFTLDVLLVDT